VRDPGSAVAHRLANLQYIVVEKSDQVGRAQDHGLGPRPERQTTDIKVVVHARGQAVFAKPGEVHLARLNIRSDDGLGRAGAKAFRPNRTDE